MYMKLKEGKSKVITFSYDDCVVQDIRLIEIFNKYGLKGTFNINTGLYMPECEEREEFYGRMKLSEAQKLYIDSGHEVAVHAYSHPFLEQLKDDEMLEEILSDRKNIENQYKVIARGMAYPFGTYNERVIELLKISGVCYSRTIKSTEKFSMPENWLELHPTCHHKNPNLMTLAERFVNESPRYQNDNWMFYIWGHSYEFDNDSNWEVIEKLAKYVSLKDDVWYATNIEIYDYIKAYENLITSVDKRLVHNPTVTDVWFIQNGKTYCVHGGETISLD